MAKHSFIKGQFKLYERVCKDDRDKLIVLTHWVLQKYDCFINKDGQEEELIDWEQAIDWNKPGENRLSVNYIFEGTEFKVKFCMDKDIFAVEFESGKAKLMLPLSLYLHLAKNPTSEQISNFHSFVGRRLSKFFVECKSAPKTTTEEKKD